MYVSLIIIASEVLALFPLDIQSASQPSNVIRFGSFLSIASMDHIHMLIIRRASSTYVVILDVYRSLRSYYT